MLQTAVLGYLIGAILWRRTRWRTLLGPGPAVIATRDAQGHYSAAAMAEHTERSIEPVAA